VLLKNKFLTQILELKKGMNTGRTIVDNYILPDGSLILIG